ncbi:hypothetical protein EBBID32_15790 [Sphingobium indicum BiD32]|uniref:Uncharacterized protein n=1 Tax=Sphingobium indicum BiD32 TaxID=1301087 RepID=N1MJ61_9SPHN|nr:hypothetical protein EBBID32_15790 [Sphingobium indicum BiD32]
MISSRLASDEPEADALICRHGSPSPHDLRPGVHRGSNDGCLPAGATQSRPVQQDIFDIGLGLGDLRDATVADPPGPCIICGKSQMVMAEAVKLLAQILRAAPQIALDAVAIDPQRRRRRRHELGQSEGVLGRIDIGLVAALANDHRIEQAHGNAVLAGDIAHHSKIAGPPKFRIGSQEPRGPVVWKRATGNIARHRRSEGGVAAAHPERHGNRRWWKSRARDGGGERPCDAGIGEGNAVQGALHLRSGGHARVHLMLDPPPVEIVNAELRYEFGRHRDRGNFHSSRLANRRLALRHRRAHRDKLDAAGRSRGRRCRRHTGSQHHRQNSDANQCRSHDDLPNLRWEKWRSAGPSLSIHRTAGNTSWINLSSSSSCG